jgi:hypothetical protein
MADEDEYEEMSSPPGTGLQQGDSNRSWHPPMSQGGTILSDEQREFDKDRLYLVSLGSLMALFRWAKLNFRANEGRGSIHSSIYKLEQGFRMRIRMDPH